MEQQDYIKEDLQLRSSLLIRIFITFFILFGIIIIVLTNLTLTSRFSQETTKQANLRLQLYANSINSEIERSRFLTLLLANDAGLIKLITNNNKMDSLVDNFFEDSDYADQQVTLIDKYGNILYTNSANKIEKTYITKILERLKLKEVEPMLSTFINNEANNRFFFSKMVNTVERSNKYIIIEISLNGLKSSWANASEAVIIKNNSNNLLLSTKPAWLSEKLTNTLGSDSSSIFNSASALSDLENLPVRAFLIKDTVLKLETNLKFTNWKIIYYTTYAPVREKVNGIIALEITALAVLLTLIFYFLSRRARIQSLVILEESNKLRHMNTRLQNEVNEREKAEKNLKVAEQTLAQTSKLAALGEMSAAVSHELNQPLAAMKTYLAGAKLLIDRSRPTEALSSFRRLDDLIERMNSITKQLKSYARKGSEVLTDVDLKIAIANALNIMSPQFNLAKIEYSQDIPEAPVIILGDQIRLEQVLINLIRNSLDATSSTPEPRLELTLIVANNAIISIKDNGIGIDDLESLFEPFYTTKKPGDGVGLGLAISSGIIKDLGGRLVAKNNETMGATFEIYLPLKHN
ncbi:MAG: ATP-binding protein [Paracoccaceae bacterium]|nr:ATP-binding protein [Paracoccaceae bacterium]